MTVDRAVKAFSRGEPVLVHDGDDREGETDVFIPAATVEWEDVRLMRNDAGGLVCVAVPHAAGRRFDLPLMDDLYGFGPSPGYDDRSSFSLTLNHASTYTGVTDRDRAATMRKLAEGVASDGFEFRSEFRSPGHVHLLLAAERGLDQRRGHTEMAVALAEEAGITPAVAICEMLDDDTGGALPVEKARGYAEKNGLVYREGEDLFQM